jgi:cytochrome c oxidase subunit 4
MQENAPERVISGWTYLFICLVLLALTALTIGLAFINLRGWNTPVALVIAAAKAGLIGLYFMHLKYSFPQQRLTIAAALLWLAILIVGTMDDVLTRGWLTVPGK